jgi:hypothetical protein
MAWCFEQGFTFPVTEFFLEDILEKTGYKIKSERDQFPGSSRRKKFSSVTKNDPLSEVFEVSLMVIQSFLLGTELSLSSRGRMTLGVGEIFLVYFSHSTTMPCPPRGWGYILIGC